MASGDDNSSLVAADSEEDIDWEEVDVPQRPEQQNIEITLQTRPKQKHGKSDKSVPPTYTYLQTLIHWPLTWGYQEDGRDLRR